MFAGHRGVTDGNELFYCPLFMVGYLMITAKGVFINQWQQCFVMCCYDTIEAKRCTLDSRVVASVASQNQQLAGEMSGLETAGIVCMRCGQAGPATYTNEGRCRYERAAEHV